MKHTVHPDVVPVTSTGPALYLAQKTIKWTFRAACCFQLLARVLCIYWTASDADFRARSLFFCVSFTILYILSAGLGLWIRKMSIFKLYMTLSRFKSFSLLRSPIPLFFILDQFLLLALPIALLVLGYLYAVNLAIGICLTLLNCTIFLSLRRCEVIDHKPCRKSVVPIICTEAAGQLQVTESRAFCIKILNISKQPLEGHLLITRHSQDDIIHIAIDLAEPLDPEVELTLIPEIHSRAGAIKVDHFRSFGYDLGDVETTVHFGQTLLAKRVEKLVVVNKT